MDSKNLKEKSKNSLWYKFAYILNISSQYDPIKVAIRIASLYLLIGSLWILLSDKFLESFVSNRSTLMFISTIKGWIYVIITACLIFILIFIALKRIKSTELELKKSYEELSDTHEELVASEEELKVQFEELMLHEKNLRTSEERFRLATEGSNDIIWDINMITNKCYFSHRLYEILGYEAEEIKLYKDWLLLIHPDDLKMTYNTAITEHFKGKTPYYSCEYRLKNKNGEYKWFYCRGKALRNSENKIIRFAGSLSDITEKKEKDLKLENSYHKLETIYKELSSTQRKLKHQYSELKIYEDKLRDMAYNDYLTGLPNRISLYEDLTKHLEKSPDINKAILFIDSDNFKFINDTLGHFCGDKLIIVIGERLHSIFTHNYKVYRIGGDEFIVYIHNYSNIGEVENSAEKILKCFKKPIDVESSILHTTVSIGIALYPQNGANIDELLKCADIAMYKSKESGKNKFMFYNDTMNEKVTERMIVEKYLHTALDNNEFIIYYQPQLDIDTMKISGFEALIRWKNPKLGFVSPIKFIKFAEDTHLIIPIGAWILKNACIFIKSLHNQGYSHLTIAVNISMLQLLQENFIDTVMQIIESVDLDPKLLELEITESILMESYEAIGAKLEQLRSKGVKIALDDFGQGYSSLSYLKQLPITTLKIDKIFIDSISAENSEKSFTDIIIMIGRRMGLTVLAEGVETQEQLKYLAKYQCHKIQGYLFSKPLPQKEAEELLQSMDKNKNLN